MTSVFCQNQDIMKNLLMIFFVLYSFTAQAEWVRGTVSYFNGEEKTGYIRNLQNEATSFVEYKWKMKDEPIKIPADEIKELTLRLKDGSMILRYLYTSTISISGEYKPSKSKVWLQVALRGDFDVLCCFDDTFGEADYYINWPGQDRATMIYIRKNGAVMENKQTLLKKSVSSIFEGRCDIMVEEVNNATFLPLDIMQIIRYYVDNCKAGIQAETVVK